VRPYGFDHAVNPAHEVWLALASALVC
jgi:hypothetical protein